MRERILTMCRLLDMQTQIQTLDFLLVFRFVAGILQHQMLKTSKIVWEHFPSKSYAWILKSLKGLFPISFLRRILKSNLKAINYTILLFSNHIRISRDLLIKGNLETETKLGAFYIYIFNKYTMFHFVSNYLFKYFEF